MRAARSLRLEHQAAYAMSKAKYEFDERYWTGVSEQGLCIGSAQHLVALSSNT